MHGINGVIGFCRVFLLNHRGRTEKLWEPQEQNHCSSSSRRRDMGCNLQGDSSIASLNLVNSYSDEVLIKWPGENPSLPHIVSIWLCTDLWICWHFSGGRPRSSGSHKMRKSLDLHHLPPKPSVNFRKKEKKKEEEKSGCGWKACMGEGTM